MARLSQLTFIALALLVLIIAGSTGCGGGGTAGTTGAGGTTGATTGGQGTITQIFAGVAVENIQAINNAGAILANRPVSQAVYESPTGVNTYLPVPSGSTQNVAYCLNSNGAIAGTCVTLNGNASVPAVWNNLTLSTLRSASVSQFPFTTAYAVNDSGQIVGVQSSSSTTQGLYWASSTSAPVTIGPTGFTASGINDSGEIVGFAASGQTTPRTWSYYLLQSSSGTPAMIGSLDDPEYVSPSDVAAIFINASGQIAYTGGSVTAPEVYLVSAGGQDKAITPGLAYSINSQGDVTGTLVNPQTPSEETGAFVYTAQNGVENLKNYLPTNSGWTLTTAHSINDSGVVVGEGNLNGVSLWYKMQLPKGAF